MTLATGTLITAARSRHPAFDKSRVPDPVLLSRLSDFENHLLARAAARNKSVVSAEVEILVNDTVFDDGYTMPASHAVTYGTAYYTDNSDEELEFTSAGRRLDPPRMPAVYLENGLLRLCGINGDWTEVERLVVRAGATGV
jgi:hypothetical protein